MKRIWQYKFHYVLALPAIVWIIMFTIVPFTRELEQAFYVKHNVNDNFKESEWVGWVNFSLLLAKPEFLDSLTKTIAYKLSLMVIVGLVSVIVAVAISCIRSKAVRNLFLILFLIPYFIPSALFAVVVSYVLSPSQNVFVLWDPSLYPIVVVVSLVIKSCGVPVIVGTAVIRAYRSNGMAQGQHADSRWLPAIRAVAAFFLLQLSTLATFDLEFLYRLDNPRIQSLGDMFNSSFIHSGMFLSSLGESSAIRIVQYLIQLVATLTAYYLGRDFLKRSLFASLSQERPDGTALKAEASSSNLIGIAVAAAFGVIVAYILYILFVNPFLIGNDFTQFKSFFSVNNFMTYFLVYGAATLISLLLTLMLAFPLTAKRLPGRKLFKIVLLIAMTMETSEYGKFMTLIDWYPENTVPVYYLFIDGVLTIAGVFVLKSIFNSRYESLKEQAEREGKGEAHIFFFLFVPKVWKPLLGLGVLHFVGLWNAFKTPIIYLSDPEAPPVFKALNFLPIEMMSEHPEVSLQCAAVVSLVPVLMLLVFYKFMKPEVFAGELRN